MIYATMMEVIFGVLAGSLVPFFLAKKVFIMKKPVVYRKIPSKLTPLIEHHQKRQLEAEGKIAPIPLPEKEKKKKELLTSKTVLEANYSKWSASKAQIPFVVDAVAILKILASMSSLPLSLEERHNLEVLSNQTEELLTNFFNTPELIREMPAVSAALKEQLAHIKMGVTNSKTSGVDNYIRNIEVGTEFIRTKFQR